MRVPDHTWRWDGAWEVDNFADSDAEGWQYGFNFKLMIPECTATCFVSFCCH